MLRSSRHPSQPSRSRCPQRRLRPRPLPVDARRVVDGDDGDGGDGRGRSAARRGAWTATRTVAVSRDDRAHERTRARPQGAVSGGGRETGGG